MFLRGLMIESLSGFAVVIPILLLFHFMQRRSIELHGKKIPMLHRTMTYAFCYLIISILSATGVPSVLYLNVDMGLNLLPFQDILSNTVQYVQNIILFIPFGFMLPLLWRKFEKWQSLLICGFCFSLTIEMLQLFNFRSTDIDDLLMNTLGAFAGYAFFILIKKHFPQILKIRCNHMTAEDMTVLVQGEVYFYIFFSWLVMFFIQPFLSGLIWNAIL